MSDISASLASIRESATQARLSGQPITSNPYPIGSSAHTEWAAFWTLVDFEASYA